MALRLAHSAIGLRVMQNLSLMFDHTRNPNE